MFIPFPGSADTVFSHRLIVWINSRHIEYDLWVGGSKAQLEAYIYPDLHCKHILFTLDKRINQENHHFFSSFFRVITCWSVLMGLTTQHPTFQNVSTGKTQICLFK
jgi:hypothetical protein